MAKSGFIRVVVTLTLLTSLAAQNQRTAAKSNQVILKYLGAAGWEITDGTTTILIDPYLSRINGPPPPGSIPCLEIPAGRMGGATSRRQTWRQSIRTFNEQILSSSLTLIMTTSWMFPTSLLKLAARRSALRAPKMSCRPTACLKGS